MRLHMNGEIIKATGSKTHENNTIYTSANAHIYSKINSNDHLSSFQILKKYF